MTTIADALDRFRCRPIPHEGGLGNPFQLASKLAEPATADEIKEPWGNRELGDALDLWSACREARLFEDVQYGQWGLLLLAPEASAVRTIQEREARPRDFRADDIVIGEFLGDQELVVLAPSEAGSRRVLVALPLDRRADWFAAASSLNEFLVLYFDAVGNKYWERNMRT